MFRLEWRRFTMYISYARLVSTCIGIFGTMPISGASWTAQYFASFTASASIVESGAALFLGAPVDRYVTGNDGAALQILPIRFVCGKDVVL